MIFENNRLSVGYKEKQNKKNATKRMEDFSVIVKSSISKTVQVVVLMHEAAEALHQRKARCWKIACR